MRTRWISQIAVAAILCVISGCGGGVPDDAPTVAPVKGKVTRNGEPFAGVNVTYQPVNVPEGGPANPSSGFTNEAGEYELVYNRNLMGAVIGDHQVRLTKDDGFDDENEGVPVEGEIIIPEDQALFEVTVPPEGFDGGGANFDLDF